MVTCFFVDECTDALEISNVEQNCFVQVVNVSSKGHVREAAKIRNNRQDFYI